MFEGQVQVVLIIMIKPKTQWLYVVRQRRHQIRRGEARLEL